jgi:DNA-binding response OmpR family regulator
MKIIVIDRDPMLSNLLSGKIRAAGHEVIESTLRQEGVEQLGEPYIDAVYFDPSPLNDSKTLLLQIRRMIRNYTYLVLMGADMTRMGAIKSGCNDGLAKPLDPAAMSESLQNAERMCALIRRLGDASYDFPSAGGVIAKSAFNQLFLSAMDRVSRYEETSRALFIAMTNYDDLKLDEGKFAADLAISKMAHNLSRLRRQSDILAQTHTHEYALLLQRPQSANEALDAAKRFAVAAEQFIDLGEGMSSDLLLDLSLVDLPSGALEFHHIARIRGRGIAAA